MQKNALFCPLVKDVFKCFSILHFIYKEVYMNNNDKSKKERLFCCYYAKLGNIFEAAVRAVLRTRLDNIEKELKTMDEFNEKVSKKHICSYV